MSKAKRRNIHFRQTPKSFKAARQTQIFSHINRNLPYNVYKITTRQFNRRVEKINSKIQKTFYNAKRKNKKL